MKRHLRYLQLFGSACALAFAVLVGIQAVRAFDLVRYYYRIAPGMLFSFPVIDEKIDYVRGVPTIVLICILLSSLTVALAIWAFPRFRRSHLKAASAICILAILAYPIGALIGILMGAALFAETRSANT